MMVSVVSTLNKYYIKVVNILINYNNCALMANRYYHPININIKINPGMKQIQVSLMKKIIMINLSLKIVAKN